jgi:hypothetical protein
VVHYKLTSPDVDYGYIFWHPLELQVVADIACAPRCLGNEPTDLEQDSE